MQTAPHRNNEAVALEALRDLDVLDSESEREFDTFVQSAARICKVPIALISLIDRDRQWFKATVGLDGISQTLRDVSFCAHAVLQDATFVIEDTLQDARFADNPMVTGGFQVRFYAAAPLCLPNNVRIGTICVMDHVARRLSCEQRSALEQLGAAVVRALQGRASLRSLAGTPAEPEPAQDLRKQVHVAMSSVNEAMGSLSRVCPHGADQAGAAKSMGKHWTAGIDTASAPSTRQEEQKVLGVQACLVSAAALLAAAHRLLQCETNATVRQRRLALRQSAADAKVAARAASGAVNVLSHSIVDLELVRGK